MTESLAYYNEIDPHAAAWLRNLIAAGLIAPGDVDERDIRDVVPIELSGYTQCHFFAGIGAWSHALRLAGWPDDRPVWTGSCPCQPFSTAGRGGGFADERHLWPAWFHLIGQCRPPVVFGEQVADKDAGPWLDLVHTDMEAMGYAFGPVVLPAAGFGAPHGRHRVFFVADAGCEFGERESPISRSSVQGPSFRCEESIHHQRCGPSSIVADSEGHRSYEQSRKVGREDDPGRPGNSEQSDDRCGIDGVGDSVGHGPQGQLRGGPEARPVVGGGLVNGFWADAEWLPCTDGKWRPAQPGTFPLADGSAFKLDAGGPLAGKSRPGLLKGYGNAIVAEVAAEFVRAYARKPSPS